MSKISELSDGSSLQSTDSLIAVRSGGNVRVKVDGALTLTNVTATSLDISGDIDVDGTANLDAVDIDGSVNIASTLTSGTDVGINSEYAVLGDDTSNRQLKLTQYQTSGSYDNAGHKINAASGYGELALAVGGTNALTLDASQNATFAGSVGIASGGAPSLSSTDLVFQVGSSSYDNPTIQIRSGTSGKGQLWFGDNSGTDVGRYDGYIEYDQSGQDFRIGTASTERMRLNATGLGIGTSSPASLLDVAGTVTCTSLVETSDAALKMDVAPIKNALDTVSALRGVTYKDKMTGDKRLGFIAQDVAPVLPELVDDSGDFLALRYGNTVGLLVEAIKEQSAKIQALTKRVEELED